MCYTCIVYLLWLIFKTKISHGGVIAKPAKSNKEARDEPESLKRSEVGKNKVILS